MPIDYDALKGEVTDYLNANNVVVLATSADNRVTARSMSYVNKGLTVYCQTDRRFLKVEQMRVNPKVALCAHNIQIEGLATIGKQPLDPSNSEFAELYSERVPQAFERFAHWKSFVVVQVEPTLVTVWKNVNGKPCRDFLKVQEQTAERIFFEMET